MLLTLVKRRCAGREENADVGFLHHCIHRPITFRFKYRLTTKCQS